MHPQSVCPSSLKYVRTQNRHNHLSAQGSTRLEHATVRLHQKLHHVPHKESTHESPPSTDRTLSNYWDKQATMPMEREDSKGYVHRSLPLQKLLLALHQPTTSPRDGINRHLQKTASSKKEQKPQGAGALLWPRPSARSSRARRQRN